VLLVSDSGEGRDAETRRHAFEPFFTTKAPDRGTGLGLATCYGLIHAAGGSIDLWSEKGIGTTFTIRLPHAQAPSQPDECPPTIPMLPPCISILLVEDDASVRSITRRLLEREGYDVDVAANGEEALQLCRASNDYDVIVSDVRMPRLSGPELICELRRRSVHTPVVFITGYQDPSDAAGISEADAVLLKPFAPNALLKVIRKAIDP